MGIIVNFISFPLPCFKNLVIAFFLMYNHNYKKSTAKGIIMAKKGFFKDITDLLLKRFIAGLLVLLPLALTYAIFKFLISRLDSIIGPFIARYLGIHIPGLGLVTLVILIWFTGLVTTNYVGKQFVHLYESVIQRIPILSTIFIGIKQISDAIFSSDKKAFSKVVVVDIPKTGIYMIGFLPSQEADIFSNRGKNTDVFHILIPASPNPTSGFLILAERKNVHPIDMSIEDGFKAVISLGVFHLRKYTVVEFAEKFPARFNKIGIK